MLQIAVPSTQTASSSDRSPHESLAPRNRSTTKANSPSRSSRKGGRSDDPSKSTNQARPDDYLSRKRGEAEKLLKLSGQLTMFHAKRSDKILSFPQGGLNL